MKNIFKIIKRIIISFCLLYTFNLITSKIGFIIPINFYSIFLVATIDFPGIMILVILKVIL